MKRLLMAGVLALAAGEQAMAADLPQPGPPPRAPATYVKAPPPVFSWTGIYVGINGGYAFGSSNFNEPGFIPGPTGNFSTNGFLAGGTLGANYQWGQFVLGIEGAQNAPSMLLLISFGFLRRFECHQRRQAAIILAHGNAVGFARHRLVTVRAILHVAALNVSGGFCRDTLPGIDVGGPGWPRLSLRLTQPGHACRNAGSTPPPRGRQLSSGRR